MTWLSPFQFPFMQDAFLIVALIAVPAALLSCFLVLKGWALMGDAISHAVLPGVVLAYLLNLPLILGAFAAGMLAALASGFLTANSRVKQDTVLGIVMSGMFGLGVVMYTTISSEVHLDHILFGNMLGLSAQDLWIAAAIAGAISAIVGLKWRDLTLFSFDPVQARVAGLPVGAIHYGLLAGLSLCVVAMLSSVGIILAVGLLIAPGAIAFLVTRRIGAMLITAVLVTEIAGAGGIYLSFWLDSEPAPTIILILTAIFIAAFLWRQWRARKPVGQSANGAGTAKITS